MTLDNSINIDILQSLHFCCVLIRFVFTGEGNNEEEICFSYNNQKEIASELNHIW